VAAPSTRSCPSTAGRTRTATRTRRVVLLHAALGDGRLWRRQVAALEGRFEVVAPDLPGFGSAPIAGPAVSPVEVAAELLPGSLVGNSFGGRVALETALARPELVERLVLVAPGLADWPLSEERRALAERREALLEAGDLDGAAELNLEAWVAPEHRDEVRPQQRRALELQAAFPDAELRWPEPRPLADLSVPALVVVGDRDLPDFRAIAEHVAAETGAELAVVAGAGHLVGLDRPEELNRLLLGFL
jgi:3-oxoadipate enol-lactonase